MCSPFIYAENPGPLRDALTRSLGLQSHYAELLNMYDGGKRRGFKTADEWMDRLREIGEIK